MTYNIEQIMNYKASTNQIEVKKIDIIQLARQQQTEEQEWEGDEDEEMLEIMRTIDELLPDYFSPYPIVEIREDINADTDDEKKVYVYKQPSPPEHIDGMRWWD